VAAAEAFPALFLIVFVSTSRFVSLPAAFPLPVTK
jgi:hypothetical protein